LEAFYSFNERFAKIRSKRITKAVKGITGKPPSDLIADSSENMSNGTKNGIGSPVDPEDDKLEASKGTEKSLAARKKSKTKESTKRKNDGNTVAKEHTKKKKINDVSSSAPAASEIENLQPCMQTEGQYDGEDLVQKKSSRGRGRGKGVGVKRGREKKSRHFQPSETETSSSSLDIDNHEPRAQVDFSTAPEVKRRVSFILIRIFDLKILNTMLLQVFFSREPSIVLNLIVNLKKDIIWCFSIQPTSQNVSVIPI